MGSVACPASSARMKCSSVELRTLHVRGEDHCVLPLGDCLSDSLVDDSFLCVSACGSPCLFGEGEFHASTVKDGAPLAESADFVIASPDICDAVKQVVRCRVRRSGCNNDLAI